MKKFTLIHKITLGIIVLSLIICVVCTGIGYHQYKKYIYDNYNKTAYNVAEIVYGMFEEEELFNYIQMAGDYKEGKVERAALEIITKSEDYQKKEAYIRVLREGMKLNDIYLAYLDKEELYHYDKLKDNWRPMTYIFDSYYEPKLTLHFGDSSGINPEFLEDAIRVVETGERSDNYFISESQYGYNTSAIYPILKDGKTIAVIGVEVPMVTLKRALTAYTTATISSIVVVTAFLMFFYLRYLYRSLIKPVNIISKEAEAFVKEDNKISGILDQIHTGDEIESLSHTILQMEIDINKYIDNLTRVTAEKERIGAELNVATQIQADMLPNIFPAFPEYEEFDIFASMTPAKEVGGDFYDFFMVDDRRVAVVMADVSGKGVPAALFMVIAKTLIKNHALNKEALSEVFYNVNNQLCENNEAGMFVTAWMGIMDIDTGVVNFVNAGHNFPLIIRKAGRVEWMKNNPDFILAGMEEMAYEEGSFTLEKGDTLYLYTDGVNEALNLQEELYGDDRLEKNLARKENITMPLEELVTFILSTINEFAGQAQQADDITMLVLRRN